MLQHVLQKAFKSYNILRPQIFNSVTNRQAVIRKKNSNYSYIRKKIKGWGPHLQKPVYVSVADWIKTFM